MTVTAAQDLKTILRYAKLARLLHEVRRAGPSEYVMEFSGPASVLRETRRYGVNFARFLPALLACKGWKMTAAIQTPWKTRAVLALSDKNRYTSALPPPDEFDSTVEEAFAKKFGPERDGWRLEREAEVLADGQTVYPQPFSSARRMMISRISSSVRGRPRLPDVRPALSPAIHRRNVRYVTMVMRCLMAGPIFWPSFSRRRRSVGVTVTRLGSFARRISFSALRYWTCRASSDLPMLASISRRG